MRVGTVCKLKVGCLGNKAGTLGVVFNDYGNGFQAIFENGNYDGFSRSSKMYDSLRKGVGPATEIEYFLEEVGFEESLAGYQFKNVMQVSEDYRKGLFNIAWSEPPYKLWKVTLQHDDEVCLIKTPVDADEDFALEKFDAHQIDEELTVFGEQPHISAVPYNPDEQKTDIEKYCGFDVCAELRRLAEKQEPKDETVLLPILKPNLWWDSKLDCEFEKVEISKLLQFIADMIE